LYTLGDLGLVIKYQKSRLESKTKITYIGFVVDAATHDFPTWWVTIDRVTQLKSANKRLLSKECCTSRQLSRVTGQCINMSLAVIYGTVML
jgi:hypothetical protein